MSEIKSAREQNTPHACGTSGCATPTFFRFCARCSFVLEEARREEHTRASRLGYSLNQAQAEQQERWNKKDE